MHRRASDDRGVTPTTGPTVRRSASIVTVVAVVLAALSACSTASSSATAAGDGGVVRVVAAENFWGSIAAQLGGKHVAGHEHHRQPRTPTRTATSRPRPTRGRSRRAARRSSTASATTPWASKLFAADPEPGRTAINVGNLARRPRRRQPAPVVLRRRTCSGDRRDRGRPTRLSTLPTGPTSQARAPVRGPTWAGVPRDDRDDPRTLRRDAGRRVESDLRSARAGARAGSSSPRTVLEGGQRGHRADRGGQVDRRRADRQDHAIKVYVYNSQNATPDVQAQRARPRPRASRSPPSPRPSRRPLLRSSVADRPAARPARRAGPGRAMTGAGGASAVTAADAAAARRRRAGGRPHAGSGVDLTVEPGEFIAVSARTASASRRWSRLLLGLLPLGAGASGARRGARRGRTTASATSRSGAASTPTCACAASTSCAWASTATAGAFRVPGARRWSRGCARRRRVDEVDRTRQRAGVRAPPGGPSSPAGSSSAC